MDKKLKEHYSCLAIIGYGAIDATKVELACRSDSRDRFALKSLNLEHFDIDEIQRETRTLRCCHDGNLLLPIEIFSCENILCIAYPLMSYGSSNDLMKSHFCDGLPEAAISYILRNVLLGLQYLHAQGFIHRSIQASHFLISDEGEVKLSGLRHAYCILKEGRKELHVHQYPPHVKSVMLWAAPEILAQDKRGYGCLSDIYSLGITACELGNGIVPFADIESTLMLLQKLNGVKPLLLDSTNVNQMIVEVEDDDDETAESVLQPYQDKHFTSAFHELVAECLERNPFERPTSEELLDSTFIKSAIRCRAHDFLRLLHPVQPIVRDDFNSTALDELVDGVQVMDLEGCSHPITWDFV